MSASTNVLEYYCWYTANIVTISVYGALLIGSDFVAALLLCMKWEILFDYISTTQKKISIISLLKMDELSIETLRQIEQNDDILTHLYLGEDYGEDGFYSNVPRDFSRLGTSIWNNTHLTHLNVDISEIPMDVAEERDFFDGLKRNNSIHDLSLAHGVFVVGVVGHEILKVYQENNNLTSLHVHHCRLIENDGDDLLAITLRCCTKLSKQ